jgi:hypothetical protein
VVLDNGRRLERESDESSEHEQRKEKQEEVSD